MSSPRLRNDAACDWVACLAAARAGSAEALGRLFEQFRPYLLAIAAGELDADLAAKVAPSDLVQETFLEGQRDFAAFRGQQPEELRAWIRQVLIHNLENSRRHYRKTLARRVDREVPLPSLGPLAVPGEHLAGDDSSPSARIGRSEDRHLVQQALARLPDHYRSVIVWHHKEGLTFEVIGARLNRSPDAVRSLWWRALQRLKQLLESPA
ncbi:MAG TPA: sigma-70 family RNA polymerase sigma factor [Gemmataceae bacterium]|nr:sigma-70 family RNA polymerase sigma factor [Gemmataceae bacterium]